MKIAVVAGETSGDILGAGLIQALKHYYPDATFYGVAGPKMQAQGCESLYDMERLAVMGFIEPLSRLPELFTMRKALIQRFVDDSVDVFIGIDAPAFNTGLEYHLKQQGITTVHYVSPSVWAWRQKRIYKIKQAVDLMLTLFPFENKLYDQHGIRNCFVGHPLADDIPLETDSHAARESLQLDQQAQTIALLPGSRMSEIKLLAPVFIATARLCYEANRSLQFVVPMVDEHKQQYFQNQLHDLAPELPIKIVLGRSQAVMAAADVILLASGTATLEALLLGKPMVVAYKLNALTYQIAKRLVKLESVALPNLLCADKEVPEFIQQAATPTALSQALLDLLQSPQKMLQLQQRFLQVHQQLRQNANDKAALAIKNVIDTEKK